MYQLNEKEKKLILNFLFLQAHLIMPLRDFIFVDVFNFSCICEVFLSCLINMYF